ncbi:hypothetical protein JXA85_08950 [Candidatus Woesearchaeota archaeon]|nr:hypothetical protein [Candidatus Woesearchaeota archaeon]
MVFDRQIRLAEQRYKKDSGRLNIRDYNITNLWKYNLPNAWRFVYTIKEDEVMMLNVILEWFSHKEYERRFGY